MSETISKFGTKKTSSFINKESPRYITRSVTKAAMEKQGTKADGTQAAHKLGWGLLNAIETHSVGRPKSDASRQELTKLMNSQNNLRIKSEFGNQVKDERRDARIADALLNDKKILKKTTIDRAVIAHNAAKEMGDPMKGITKSLGELKIFNPETGRCHKLKNHSKFA